MSHPRQVHYVNASWLRNQRTLALLTNVSGSLDQLALYDVLSKQLRIITHGEESIKTIHPSPDGASILYTASRDGHEKMQMYLYTIDTREHRALTANALAAHRGVAWSPDGRYIVYSANSTHESDFHIFELDTLTHEITPIVIEEGCWDSLGYSPSGRYIVVRKRKSFHDHELCIWDRHTRSLHMVLSQVDDVMECKLPYWSPDESVLFVLSNRNVDCMRVLAIHLSSGHIQTVHESEHDIDMWAMTSDGERIVVAENINGRHVLRVVERSESGWILGITRDIQGYVSGFAWSSDDQVLAVEYQSPHHFPHILIVDRDLQLLTRIPQQEDKVLELLAPIPKEFSFTTSDNQTIHGWYYLPQNEEAKPFPVVVHLHGGPEDQYRFEYNQWIHKLVDEGYAVVAPNMRGSIGYGKRFMSADNKEKRFDAIAELQDLHAWITQQPMFNEKKAALTGGSYGAYLALAGLVWHPGLWQVGICRVGMYDLLHFLEHTAPWRKYLRAFEYGHPDTEQELLQALSPLTYIDRATSPILFIHGRNDVRVSVAEVERASAALKGHGRIVDSIIFDNEGHSIEREENIRTLQQKSVLFLEQYLVR